MRLHRKGDSIKIKIAITTLFDRPAMNQALIELSSRPVTALVYRKQDNVYILHNLTRAYLKKGHLEVP